MSTFNVLSREEVSPKNQQRFDKIKAAFGKVPNLYTVLAYSENALETYFNLETAPTSLTARQAEVVNLAVSEANECAYCLSAHTVIAKMNGFTDEQASELRKGTASFDKSLEPLAKLAKGLAEHKGFVNGSVIEEFLQSGYTKENLMDVIMLVGDRTISNILHAVSKVSIDFPLAPGLKRPVQQIEATAAV